MLGEVVGEAARRFGDTVAQVAASGWEVTYADLDRLSDEVAAGFRTRGLREGEVVALVLPSVPEYAIAYLGAAKAGLVTAGVNPRLSATERDAVLSVADPRLVLATAELAPRAGDIVEVTPAAHGDSALTGVGGGSDPGPRPAPETTRSRRRGAAARRRSRSQSARNGLRK